jgi:hypothetical protein
MVSTLDLHLLLVGERRALRFSLSELEAVIGKNPRGRRYPAGRLSPG